MASDKEDSPPTVAASRKLKFEQLRADYELFLQTFEKPTWLYRHMQRRFCISPYMLSRNLSYLRPLEEGKKKKRKKQQDKRKSFKVDSLLDILKKKEKKKQVEESDDEQSSFMNITFGGFFHGPGFAEEIFHTSEPKIQDLYKDEFVRVDIHLIKVYNKKKKDTEPPMDIVRLGQCQAPWNPRSQLLLPSSSVKLSIPPAAFQEEGRAVKTYIISITVCITVPKKVKRKGKRKTLEEVAPPSKRLRSESGTEDSSTLTQGTDDEMDSFLQTQEKTMASYSAELIVYDRHKTCLLTEGVYELLLQPSEETSKNMGKSNSWENNFKTKLGPFAAFSFGPTIKFNLTWDIKPLTQFSTVYNDLEKPYVDSPQPLSNALSNGHHAEDSNPDPSSIRIFYQFIYNNSTRQQTEAKQGLCCPWCSLDCRRLYGLLKHLKCAHQRFSFVYTKLKRGHRIDVCPNEKFEGQLDFDGVKDIGFINIDDAPVHRKPQADIVVWRPVKHKEDLSEFSEPDPDEISLPSQAHGRIYYHIRNNQQVVNFNEFNCRNEDEMAPDWLKQNMQSMMEEFTDVNEGEKEVMKMWNLFALQKGFIADFSVALGCKLFVEEYGNVLIEKDLTRNFIVHLNNLLEFQVISQSTVAKTVDFLYKMKNSLPSGK